MPGTSGFSYRVHDSFSWVEVATVLPIAPPSVFFRGEQALHVGAAPLVCADSLFAESDMARLLTDTQTSSSLQSQQVLVDVASRGSGVRRRHSSPARSLSSSSPACRRHRESGSPSRPAKRVRFDSPAPSSILKSKQGFRR